jgi:hypothetical protein
VADNDAPSGIAGATPSSATKLLSFDVTTYLLSSPARLLGLFRLLGFATGRGHQTLLGGLW